MHLPVLCNEMIQALAPKDGEVYLDGTFGAGGYTRAMLNAAECKVFSIDRDPLAAGIANAFALDFSERFCFLTGTFSDMVELLEAHSISAIDAVVMDIGVSSMQIDDAERGFSFKKDGPLDMRMSQQGISAAEVVNTLEEKELADIIRFYGEEKGAGRIARAIVKQRETKPFSRTHELAALVSRVLGKRPGDAKDPATRTFQALRVHVNDELGQLQRGLEAAESLLKPGGRLIVVTFHSLEDRIVKQFLQTRSGVLSGVSRHVPDIHAPVGTPAFLPKSVRLVKPTEEEMERNPRARSAKLRVGIRSEAGFGGLKCA